MNCDQCNTTIPEGDVRDHQDQTLCEDCYMDALSTVKACDPWAVYTAKNLEQSQGGQSTLNDNQAAILDILDRNGPQPPDRLRTLVSENGRELTQQDLDRELASLRHMEKISAELHEGEKRIRKW